MNQWHTNWRIFMEQKGVITIDHIRKSGSSVLVPYGGFAWVPDVSGAVQESAAQEGEDAEDESEDN